MDYLAPQRAYVTEEINIQRFCVDEHYVAVGSYQMFRGQPGIQPQPYLNFGEISPGKGPIRKAMLWYRLNGDGLINNFHLDELEMPEGMPTRSEDWDARQSSKK